MGELGVDAKKLWWYYTCMVIYTDILITLLEGVLHMYGNIYRPCTDILITLHEGILDMENDCIYILFIYH